MHSEGNKTRGVITRFAPSPTGLLHIGSVRTAMFNYLFANKHGGKFILRIEDTDKSRSEKKYEEDIINGLRWLGLSWNEFHRQSERTEVYKEYLKKLINEGKAYFEDSAVRFKNPNKKISFEDDVRGKIEIDTTDVGDFVIAKDLDTPLFHFTVVVDDFEMKVTHVIRGEDHIPNTPRHILLQEAMGFYIPKYAHLPLILGTDKTKLSKRHGAVSVNDYRKMGYLPEAIVNFLAFIGWNPGGEQEIFSKEELINIFSLEKVQKSAGVFNIERLNWYNKEYIKKTKTDDLSKMLMEYLPADWREKASEDKEYWLKIVELEKDRITLLADINDGIGYFFTEPEYGKELLLWKKEKSLDNTKKHLIEIVNMMEKIDAKNFTAENVKIALWDYAEKEGRGNVLWPLRVSLTGLERSPEPFAVASILGKNETMLRIKKAIEII